MKFHQCALLILSLVITMHIQARAGWLQQEDTVRGAQFLSFQYLGIVSSKAGKAGTKLDKQTGQALQQWQEKETRNQKSANRRNL